MRKIIFAATSIVGLSVPAFATMDAHMPSDFGPVMEIKTTRSMKGQTMHMQVIQDDSGLKYVIIPLAEAEMMIGPISASAMHISACK
jgi:hypothetical protein